MYIILYLIGVILSILFLRVVGGKFRTVDELIIAITLSLGSYVIFFAFILTLITSKVAEYFKLDKKDMPKWFP